MPLATFVEMLGDAVARKYAVGSFNAWDAYAAKSIIGAAERTRSPVIISLWQPELDLAGERELYLTCLSFGKHASVPVAVFIDHARDLATVERAIRLGATSVMVDGSHLSLGDNVRLTSRAAALAHGARVSIEGEIGILGEEDGSEPEEKHYTDAGDADLFVKETRVDALAVAIGNAHGFYKRPPRLDFARLAEIRSRVQVPLVLHGGSGIPPGDIRRAVGMGIAKVNIGAEARSAFMRGLRRSLADAGEHEKFPHRVFPAALECHARVVEEKMELLLSSGKA